MSFLSLKLGVLIGSLLVVAQLEAQSSSDLANMARLVGNWRYKVHGSGEETEVGHYVFSQEGNDIVITYAFDKDIAGARPLKGEGFCFGRFRLNGRRLSGNRRIGNRRIGWTEIPITGVVSEDFNRIDWRFPLRGVRDDSPAGSQAYQEETLFRK